MLFQLDSFTTSKEHPKNIAHAMGLSCMGYKGCKNGDMAAVSIFRMMAQIC